MERGVNRDERADVDQLAGAHNDIVTRVLAPFPSQTVRRMSSTAARHNSAEDIPVATKQYPIPIPYDAIAEFCRRNHIRKLSLFGSVLRDDFTPESDVDVLAEFEPGRTPGWHIVTIETELTTMLGRTVDLRTASELSEYFRDEVLSEAEEIYVAA